MPLGNKLEILIMSSLTQSNEFPNAETVSCGGVATLEMAWICKKISNFWRVVVIFTSYVLGKLIRVGNHFTQFGNYLKISQTQIKGIKRILQRNNEYISTP